MFVTTSLALPWASSCTCVREMKLRRVGAPTSSASKASGWCCRPMRVVPSKTSNCWTCAGSAASATAERPSAWTQTSDQLCSPARPPPSVLVRPGLPRAVSSVLELCTLSTGAFADGCSGEPTGAAAAAAATAPPLPAVRAMAAASAASSRSTPPNVVAGTKRRRRKVLISPEEEYVKPISELGRRGAHVSLATTLPSTDRGLAPLAIRRAPSPRAPQETSKAVRDMQPLRLSSGSHASKTSGWCCRPTGAVAPTAPPAEAPVPAGANRGSRLRSGGSASAVSRPTALTNSSQNSVWVEVAERTGASLVAGSAAAAG
mmetsp:Transcript_5107/g.14074  ORF Transcript_5107/g.14074 Transcript_5107/m.14074 type:complete len:317 (+) Transcript_5107:162-1112(+)